METADKIAEAGTLEVRRGQAVSAVAYLPRLLIGALGDLRSIAESAKFLPEVAARLTLIQEGVDSMGNEVARMRRAVEAVGSETEGVREGVERIEPHLEELRGAMSPLRRTADRMRRIAGR